MNIDKSSINLNKSSMNYLLKIAKKYKLFDLNISEFYRTLCIHYKRLLLTHNETLDDNSLLKTKKKRQIQFSARENLKLKQFNKFLKLKNNKNVQQQQQDPQEQPNLFYHHLKKNVIYDHIGHDILKQKSSLITDGVGSLGCCSGITAESYSSSSIDEDYDYDLEDLDDDVFNDFPMGINECKCKYLSKTNYFNEKFNDIFSLNLKLLNGFNDLFLLASATTKTAADPQIEFDPKKFQILGLEYIIELNEMSPDKPAAPIKNFNAVPLADKMKPLRKQRSNTSIDSFLEFNNMNNDTTTPSQVPNQTLFKIKRSFQNFNLSCFCNLLQKNDLETIKKITAKAKTNSNNKVDIKVFLRFYWYSFNSIGFNKIQSAQAQDMSKSKNKLNEKFSSFNLINPLVDDLKWHLNNEILQHKIHLNSLNDFNLLVKHIEEGNKRKHDFCRYLTKEIVFNTKLKINDSLEQFKFIQEFLDLLSKLKGKFYGCYLKKLDNYNYFLNCFFNSGSNSATHNRTLTEDNINTRSPIAGGSSTSNTFKILIRIIDYHSAQSRPSRTPSPTVIPTATNDDVK